MTHIMKMRCDMYKDDLRSTLEKRTDLNDIGYKDLVKITFETVYNRGVKYDRDALNLDKITEIDDGDYQGSLLFLIPFDTYQPSPNEYIMTSISYGSCSGCDALQAAQICGEEQQVSDIMTICKDLVCNAIKPYNYAWYYDREWDRAEEQTESGNV